ncbi:hypothetical protein BDV96DRAFT_634112 [Lophiotrema nucula]|uniref:Uncharacterized protein n=1 Tax=Lophiotrema nucula TaxID=690887 RepID=A0A6A5YZ48_9PLEO|nr:hypothetical protein BDV96DRAFT_634112 [Lophiotrema nucula]
MPPSAETPTPPTPAKSYLRKFSNTPTTKSTTQTSQNYSHWPRALRTAFERLAAQQDNTSQTHGDNHVYILLIQEDQPNLGPATYIPSVHATLSTANHGLAAHWLSSYSDAKKPSGSIFTSSSPSNQNILCELQAEALDLREQREKKRQGSIWDGSVDGVGNGGDEKRGGGKWRVTVTAEGGLDVLLAKTPEDWVECGEWLRFRYVIEKVDMRREAVLIGCGSRLRDSYFDVRVDTASYASNNRAMEHNDPITPTSATNSSYDASLPSSPTAAQCSAGLIFPWMQQFPDTVVKALQLADERDTSGRADVSESGVTFDVMEKLYLPDSSGVDSRGMFEESKKQSRVIGGFKTRRGANLRAASYIGAMDVLEKDLDVYVKGDGSLWIVVHPYSTPSRERREVFVQKHTFGQQMRSGIDDRAEDFRVIHKRRMRRPSV